MSPERLIQSFLLLNGRIRQARHWFFASLVITGLVPWLTAGMATAGACLFIACTLWSMTNFARERGLWMLAILWTVFSSVFYLFAAAGPVLAALHGRRPDWPVILDLAIAARLLMWQIRTLLLFVHVNRRFQVVDVAPVG